MSDRERYDEIDREMCLLTLSLRKQYDPALERERFNLWRELEQIKNRHGGMPPKEEA